MREEEYEGKYDFAKQPAKDLAFFRDICPKFHVFKLLQIREYSFVRNM